MVESDAYHQVWEDYSLHRGHDRSWASRRYSTYPTSASWLNAVEGFFSILTRRRLKRGAFTSVADFQDAIARYIRQHNNTPEFLRLDKNRQSHPRHCL